MVIDVLVEPDRELAAVNVTTWEPDWLAAGVHANVPLEFPAPA
jgi:hypothetical protein